MNTLKLNKTSTKFINQFKEQILKVEKKWKNNSSLECNEFSNNDITLIPNIEYYQSTILHSLQSFAKKKCIFHFSTSSRKICVHLISPIEKTNEQILLYLKYIFIWFNFIDSYSNSSCSANLEIYLSLTPCLKLIPSNKYVPLDKKNANTAFTFTCKKNNVIHIFREEEWFKVLIHETFHNLDLDFSNYDQGYSNQFIQLMFPINLNFKFYESYCETWAIIFHSLFYSIYNKKSFIKTLNSELDFSLFQCVKILDHFNMKYTDLYVKTYKAENARSKYSENTPVLSYYFFKTIFLYHINDFLQWCIRENKNSVRFSNLPSHYINIYQKIEQYVSLLNRSYKNVSFLNTMKEKEREFQKNKKNILLNDIFHFKTMKMSMHDLYDNTNP